MKQADRKLTLEQIEGVYWQDHEYDSDLSRFSHEYRKIPLEQMGVEQVRLLIGQNIGSEFLIPLAIEMLEYDILASGDLFEGDLLMAVLTSDPALWRADIEAWDRVRVLVENNMDRLENSDVIYEGVKKDLVDAYEAFEKILEKN